MKIEQIVYFVNVAKNHSISVTADQLHISQPAISVALSDLENEFEIKLFHRSRQGTELTEHGERLLPYAETILKCWEELKNQANIESCMVRGGISLSVVPSLSYTFLPSIMKNFKEVYPQININIYSGGTTRCLKNLATGKSQLAMISCPEDFEDANKQYVFKSMFETDTVAVANNEFFKKLPSDTVSLKELAQFPMLTFTSDYAAFALLNQTMAHEKNNASIIAVESHDMLQNLCVQGMGIGFLPLLVARNSPFTKNNTLHILKVIDLNIKRNYAVVYLKNTPMPKPLLKLLDIIENISKSCHDSATI